MKFFRYKKTCDKEKNINFLSLLLVLVMVVTFSSDAYAGTEDTITKEYEYTAKYLDDRKNEFDETISDDDETYNLTDIKYEVVGQTPILETVGVGKVVTTEDMIVNENYSPQNTISENGVDYILTDCTILDGSQYTRQYTEYYDFIATDVENIPQTKAMTVKDEAGNTVEVAGTLKSKEVTANGDWKSAEIEIVFENYDAGVFEWQGVTINGNSDEPLKGYETELLQSVGETTDSCKIISTEWVGAAYEENGVMYRKAKANVQQYVNYVRATYTANVDYAKYTCIYHGTQQVPSTTDFEYQIKAVATYTLKETLPVKEIILACLGLVFIIALVVVILLILSKRKATDNDNSSKKSKEEKEFERLISRKGQVE